MDHTDARLLVAALSGTSETQQDFRRSGVVTQVDADGTTWVRLDGSSTPTPCTRFTATCKPGDNVSVIVLNGRAVIEGNYTAPATNDEVAKSALSKVSVAQKIAVTAQKLAGNAVSAANTTKKLASSAHEAAKAASDAITPVLNDLNEIKGEEETFLAGLEKTINTMTASFASSKDLAQVQRELETSISQTAEKIEMVASSDTALQLSEKAQEQLRQAIASLTVAQMDLDAARESYNAAKESYDALVESDASEEQIAQAEQAVTDAKNTLDVAQKAYDNIQAIIDGIKTNYASRTELELLAEGLKLLFSSEEEAENSYITLTKDGIRLGDIGTPDAYLNIASDKIAFVQNAQEVATIEDDVMYITRVKTTDELSVNNWRWKQRANGNISFKWRGE